MTIVERNPDGTIKKKELSSEEAKTLATKKRRKRAAEKQSDVEILLEEAGYPDPEEAPRVLQFVAEQIAEAGPRSIQAVVQYRQLTSPHEHTAPGRPDVGERCALCGQWNLGQLSLSADQKSKLLEFIGYARSHGQGKQV